MHRRRENQPGYRDRPPELLVRAGLVGMHRGASLRKEVLDDHLLDVAVTTVRFCDRLEAAQSVLAGVSYADKEACREWDRQLTGEFQRGEPAGRHLVGRSPVTREV